MCSVTLISHSKKKKKIVFVPASNADLTNKSRIFPIFSDEIGKGKELGRVILPNRSKSKQWYNCESSLPSNFSVKNGDTALHEVFIVATSVPPKTR